MAKAMPHIRIKRALRRVFADVEGLSESDWSIFNKMVELEGEIAELMTTKKKDGLFGSDYHDLLTQLYRYRQFLVRCLSPDKLKLLQSLGSKPQLRQS